MSTKIVFNEGTRLSVCVNVAENVGPVEEKGFDGVKLNIVDKSDGLTSIILP